MLVAASASRLDACTESAFCVRGSRKAGQELTVLEIAGNVIGAFSKELFKVLYSRRGIALCRAFHRQSVPSESVLRVGREKFFK